MPSLPRPWLRPVVRAGEAAFAWLGRRVLDRRISSTGYANPRVKNLVGRLGYALYTYRVTKPAMNRWTKGMEVFPSLVQVQTINRCQAACEFCPYPDTVALQPRRTMPGETWSKIARECASEPELRTLVPMSKNEPLLDQQLEERIAEFAAIRRPHQLVEIVSNGAGLTLKRLKRLGEAGLDLVSVSLNAADEATFTRVMKGLSWRRITANLDEIAAADLPTINVFLRYTQSYTNRRGLRRFRRRWRSLNLFGFTINNRAGTVTNYQGLRIRHSRPVAELRRGIIDHLYQGCPYVFSVAHVLANGDVPLCENDWKDRIILGNVNDTSLREVFNSPRLNEIRRLHVERRFDEVEPCRDCSLRREYWS